LDTAFKYDAVVVLGAAVRPDGSPSGALLRRTLHAVDLLKKGEAHYLVASGGSRKNLPSEASVIRDIAVKNGIPPDIIFLEDRSVTTLENIIYSSSIIKANSWTRIVFTTDPYHIKRAGVVFRHFGIEAIGSAAPGGFEQNSLIKWLFYYCREFVARAWYRFYLCFKSQP
jgi:uncharacterized SAM-binding protein YcdF (DUF218 family)